jgi:hypothetical protein
VLPLVELWDLMDSPEEERRGFRKAAAVLRPAKDEALSSGVLSMATIKKTGEEVERMTRLKAGRMKELVLKRRLELENICRSMHVEPDASTVPEKSIALIDSGTLGFRLSECRVQSADRDSSSVTDFFSDGRLTLVNQTIGKSNVDCNLYIRPCEPL